MRHCPAAARIIRFDRVGGPRPRRNEDAWSYPGLVDSRDACGGVIGLRAARVKNPLRVQLPPRSCQRTKMVEVAGFERLGKRLIP